MKILLFVLALWAFMSIAPSDGKDVRRYYGPKGTICKKGHHWIVKIKCTDKCKIRHPKAAFQTGGKVRITGRMGEAFRQKKNSCGRNCFCIRKSRKNWNQVFCKNHKGKKITSNRVHFDIWCIKRTTKLRFRAYVKNIGKPKMMEKKCPTGQNRHEDGVCRECANKEYKNNADVCTPCNCGTEGSKFQSCKTTTGKCICRAGYKDRDCKTCKDQFYKPTGQQVCSACGCNNPGTTNGGKCGADGKCTCDTANYKGNKCENCQNPAKFKHVDGVCRTCQNGKYDSGSGCTNCNCGVKGSKFQTCAESTGDCDCKDGYKDRDCKTCDDKFYKKVDECLACGCDPDGSQNSGNCVANTGVCTCKVEATGDKCDGCASTHYKPAAGGACVACACDTGNTKGGVDSCDNTGQCPCVSGKTAKDCSS